MWFPDIKLDFQIKYTVRYDTRTTMIMMKTKTMSQITLKFCTQSAWNRRQLNKAIVKISHAYENLP